jgi:hypothetical protein
MSAKYSKCVILLVLCYSDHVIDIDLKKYAGMMVPKLMRPLRCRETWLPVTHLRGIATQKN